LGLRSLASSPAKIWQMGTLAKKNANSMPGQRPGLGQFPLPIPLKRLDFPAANRPLGPQA
jgi:hypothetical protein